MKKIIMGIALLITSIFAHAQLNGVIVEKYYISNSADATAATGNGDALPVGTTTYRIYVNMAPSVKFQAAYGVNGANPHTLILSTTTSFYNNTDRGAEVPSMSFVQDAGNTNMIDSWFSVGAACTNRFGVLKAEDGAGGGANEVNTTPGVLANNNPAAGIPLTTADGIWNASPMLPQAVTFVGMATQVNDFGGGPSVNLVSITNGSWASLNGSTGPVAGSNKVLIAQMTTNGIFHYELNLQLKDTATNIVYNYVATNPVGSEISVPSLSGTLGIPNILPTVNITAPANNTHYFTGNVVNLTANANDSDGSITQVDWFLDGTALGNLFSTDNTGPSPYTATWTSTVGTHVWRARATDNDGGQVFSTPDTVIVGNNIHPTVNITSPAPSTIFLNTPVPISANANDPDGNVVRVDFFVNNVFVGSDNTGPSSFTFTWIPSFFGTANLTAVAVDNANDSTTSTVVPITIANPNALPYAVGSSTNTCVSSTFCVPVAAVDTVHNVIGYDVVMHYNSQKVIPTGIIDVFGNLINTSYVSTVNSIDGPNANISVSLFLNGSAPIGTYFHGVGNIFCVEFAKTANFNNVDTVPFNIVSLQESYVTGVTLQPADAGQYITYRDSIFTGKLNFWEDNSPIVYDGSNPSAHLITNINGNNTNCNNPSLVAVQPDLTGNFTYNTTNGPDITITKNIAPTTSVQPVINGFDVFLTKRVLQNDPAFVPTIFQLIAMDVNLDGVISAGDASQINQRAVLILPEFQQAWNYTSSGVPLGPLSKDWLFVDNSTLNSNPHYRVSLTYPFDDGIGASKYRVPQIPFCLTLPNSSTDTSGNCQLIITESYQGVLLGDINGNYATAASSSFRPNSTDEVVFDLSRSVSGDGYVDVPVSVLSMNAIKSLDFAIGVKEAKLSFNSISVNSSDIESLANYNANDKTLRVTSNSSQNYEIGKPVISVRFNSASGQVTPMELNSVEAFLNGERVAAEIKTDASSDVLVNIFPNPANEQLNVVVPQDANIQLLDASGKVISFMTLSANKLQVLGTKDLASGVYMLKVYNDNFVTVRRVVIQK